MRVGLASAARALPPLFNRRVDGFAVHASSQRVNHPDRSMEPCVERVDGKPSTLRVKGKLTLPYAPHT